MTTMTTLSRAAPAFLAAALAAFSFGCGSSMRSGGGSGGVAGGGSAGSAAAGGGGVGGSATTAGTGGGPSGPCGGCSGSTPVCDAASLKCVGCSSDGDCGGDTPICDLETKSCRFSVAGTWQGHLSTGASITVTATETDITAVTSKVTVRYAGNSCASDVNKGSAAAPVHGNPPKATVRVAAPNAYQGWDIALQFASSATGSGSWDALTNGGLICDNPAILSIGTDDTVLSAQTFALSKGGAAPPDAGVGGDAGSPDARGGDSAVGATCAPVTAAGITDFSDWDPAKQQWGSVTGPRGIIATFGVLGGQISAAVDTAAHDLQATGTFSPDPSANFSLVGVLLAFNACVDASAYSGVELSLTGSLGGASPSIGVDTVSDTCASGCLTANTPVSGTGTVSIRWGDLTNGGPKPFDPREITDIQVTLMGTASASFDIHIDDVRFTPK